MYFEIDHTFLNHFKNLQQVFLYITDECNLRCKQCLYKPNLTFQIREREIPIETSLNLISDFKEMGASKLTIMGGEPTLYGRSQNYRPLLKLINESKKMGYEYVRIDTNGVFEKKILEESIFKKLDEITFSLDGHTAEINDELRGKSSFEKCLNNIKTAVAYGYNVDITCCLHKKLLKRDENGTMLLDSLIQFAADLGVSRINFHDLFKTGVPRDTWTGNFDTSIEEWRNMLKEVNININQGKYQIPVRIPQCFVTRDEFSQNPEYFRYCSAKMGERVLVHPNGIIRICSLMIGTPYGVARYYDNKIEWDYSPTNELISHDLDKPTPCTNQSKKNYGDFLPLCVSFKPSQDEFIWKKIEWERKRIRSQIKKILI